MGRDFFNHKMGLHVKLWDVCHSHRSRLLHQKINSWCLFALLIWSVSCKDIKQLSFDSQLLKLQVFQKITISNEICKVWNQIISNCHITNYSYYLLYGHAFSTRHPKIVVLLRFSLKVNFALWYLKFTLLHVSMVNFTVLSNHEGSASPKIF